MTKNTAVFNSKCKVTQDDIDNGLREDGDSCPIALAMNRCINNQFIEDYGYNDLLGVNVSGDGEILVTSHKECIQAGIDVDTEFEIEIHPDDRDQVLSFITTFDADYDVEPFIFRYKE
tara:strand:+ start:47478 stop:47831 length:354 start_codon:yes stop_codon:yes gene_type:complete